MRYWLFGLLLLFAASARAEEALILSGGMITTSSTSAFFAHGPYPVLGLAVVEPRVLTPFTGVDLSLAVAADLYRQHGMTDASSELPAPWYQMRQLRDRWLAASQALRGFVEVQPGLELGAGLGLHEIVPIEEAPGHRGDQHGASLEKIHYQWRRHVFIRFSLLPHGRHGLVLELEHQLALRRADYFEEPRSGYLMKLGYRFPG